MKHPEPMAIEQLARHLDECASCSEAFYYWSSEWCGDDPARRKMEAMLEALKFVVHRTSECAKKEVR